ncbi:MAG: T9SS type A sorting domain-containing protein [Bacteroidales bacterium]|nr:T9SS type A sorting domain-containing protein [Bacteroidales bacterium]
MRKILLLIAAVFVMQLNYAEGWRTGEKQIQLSIDSQETWNLISTLKLSFDAIGENQIRAYVVPKELEQLSLAGISYEIEIDDLAKYSLEMQNMDASWHSYQDIIELADSLVQEFPSICQKVSFGTSLGGRQLAALKISDNVSVDENEAEVLFDGGIHGDEYCGAENIIRFARKICIDYGNDPDITYLIDNREIWLYLMVNPDGRVNVIRYNNNGVDLNRDWSYMWDAWGGSTGACSQVESKALRECMYNNQFVVHTTYHGGTEYISLPWSYRSSQPTDWNHIYQLGGVYSNTSLYPNLEYGQGNSGMYPINGSTKDSNYGMMGSISWSMEISYDKMPPTSQIMLYYNRNVPAMLAMIEYAGYGLEGVVTDAISGDPVEAIVFVNNYFPTYSDATAGDYHKYVLPGTYSITVMANGYETQTISNVVVSANSSTATDFQLQPQDGQYAFKFSASSIPDNNEADEGWTPGALGAPDDINYSIGKNGWVVLDMQTPVIDGPGTDLIVYEGDTSPEGFTCYAGETMDGPWISLGTGTGTTEFDLSNGPLVEAQYIKLVDDGDGAAVTANAGFDLDAIEAMSPVSGVYIALYDYEIDDSNGNNNGRIDPGETVDIIVNLKNNGDIIADNTTGIVSTSSPYITIDNSTANFGNLAQGQSADGTFTITANAGTPQGEAVALNLNVEANGGTYNNTFMMSFTVGLIVEDWETGTMDQFDWETGGNANWDISTQSPYEGTYCIKSGSINDQQTTFLSITFDVLANGDIGFYKKVSSEASYDYLKFYIDGNMMDQWAGEVAWSESSFPVTAGNHTFKWEYEKDYSVSSGSDCAWLDFITLPSGALTALYAGFTSDNNTVCEEEVVSFFDASSGDVISWDWTFEGGSPATSTFQNPEVAYFTAGSYDVGLTVSDGTDTHTISIEDYITVLTEPDTPDQPDGPYIVAPEPGITSDYATNEVSGATDYSWTIEPAEAGSLSENGTTCTVDWTDYWEGIVLIKVKALNDCGESEYSEGFEVLVIDTWVNEIEKQDVLIHPNPATDKIIISIQDGLKENTMLKIVNNLGEIVLSENIEKQSTPIDLNLDLSSFEPGIYFIIIRNNELQLNQKLILK